MIIAYGHYKFPMAFLADGKQHTQRLFDPFRRIGKKDKKALVIADQMDAVAVKMRRLRDHIQHHRVDTAFIAVAALSQQDGQVHGVFNLYGRFLRRLKHFLPAFEVIPDKIPDKPGLLQLQIFLLLLLVRLYQHLDAAFYAA